MRMDKYSSCTYSTLNECLPYIDFPFYNECLIGYLLRLDYLNGFSPSSILRLCLKKDTNQDMDINEYSIEDLEESIDLSYISRLTSISPSYINKMKISTIRKKLFRYNCTATKEHFRYGDLKICPECIKQWRIPQIFLFDSVNTCLLHGCELVTFCSCNKKINLLNTTSDLICNKCNTDFSKLYTPSHTPPTDFDSKYLYQSILTTYLTEDISIIHKNEKLLNGLNKRINYLENIKFAGFKTILKTNYVNEKAKIVFQKYNRNINEFLNLNFIISLIKEFSISPFQFLSYNSSDFSAKITSQIQSITCQFLSSKGNTSSSESYFVSLMGSKKNLSPYSWEIISAMGENKSVIYYDAMITSGENVFILKCCAYG